MAVGLGKDSLHRNSLINMLWVRSETVNNILVRCHLREWWGNGRNHIHFKVPILLPS